MKKIFTYIMLFSLSSASFMSCSSSKKSKGILGGAGVSGTIVKTVATVVGLILLSKLLKSVLGTITGSTAFTSLEKNQQFITSFNEDTKLSSFAQNDLMKMALQVLVSEGYKITLTTVVKNYNSLTTAGDLATFIGQNADAKVLEAIK